MKFKKSILSKLVIIFSSLLIIFIGFIIYYFNLTPYTSYTSEYFGIETLKSNIDFNNNSIDDYTDILNGAKIEAKNHPKYVSNYYQGGYPPDDEGVCT